MGGEVAAVEGDGCAWEGEDCEVGEGVTPLDVLNFLGGERGVGEYEVGPGGVGFFGVGKGSFKYLAGAVAVGSKQGYAGGIEVDGSAEKEPLIGLLDFAEGVVGKGFANNQTDKPIGKGGVDRKTTVHSHSPYEFSYSQVYFFLKFLTNARISRR